MIHFTLISFIIFTCPILFVIIINIIKKIVSNKKIYNFLRRTRRQSSSNFIHFIANDKELPYLLSLIVSFIYLVLGVCFVSNIQ